MEYAVIFEEADGGKTWGAYMPDFPGLGVAGDTFAETQELIRIGFEMHLEGMRTEGEEIPEPRVVIGKLAA